MANTKLLIKLRELHEELASINDNLDAVEQIDDETVDALGDLVSDLSGVMDHARAATARELGKDEHHDLAGRIMQFESEHPRVTRFLSQMTDMLAMMGI